MIESTPISENGHATLAPERHGLAREVAATLRLAAPVVVAELGWMAMGVVDLMMVGRLGTNAIAAVGLGNIVFFSVTVCGLGLMMGLDTLVSQAFGAKRIDECHRWIVQGSWMSLAVSAPLIALTFLVVPLLKQWGIDAAVVDLSSVYLRTLVWGTPALFLYFALRRYLQAMNLTLPAMLALLAANIANVVGNWLLIEGHWGAPRLGLSGSAWATTLARFAMFGLLAWYAIAHSAKHQTGLTQVSWRPDWKRQLQLLKVGGPAAIHFQFEVGVFALAAILAGRFGANALAAHELVLNVASVTFMVPFGVASAGAVRVGHAIGRRDAHGASISGWAALGIGAGFMALAGLALSLSGRQILSIFSAESIVVATAMPLLLAAAVFQLFDGTQVVAGGILRGAGDTRAPMFASLTSYWLLGLPFGAWLAFGRGVGVLGLWIGLCLGLICAALFLLVCWLRTTRRWRTTGVAPLVSDMPEPLEAVGHTC